MKLREAFKRHRNFDPHETAHAIALEGVPLAEFRQRALAIAIDFFVVLVLLIPIEVVWALFGAETPASSTVYTR